MQNKICHIGFPKTGTTFLQKKIFPQIKGVRYCNDASLIQILNDLIDKDDTIFDQEEVRKKMEGIYTSKKQPVLFSYEPLTGHHYQTRFPNRTQIAKRLKKAGINKVIMTIRNQVDVLESTYRQYIKSGGVLKVSEYFNFDPKAKLYFDIQYFDYLRIVELYDDVFGKENVLILQYEDLQFAKTDYYKKLFDFLEVEAQDFSETSKGKVNKSISTRGTKAMRLINHFTFNSFRPSHLLSRRFSTSLFYRVMQKLSGKRKNEKRLVDKYESDIQQFFATSNAALEMRFGVKLHERYCIDLKENKHQ